MTNSLSRLGIHPGTIIELVPAIRGSVAPEGIGDRFRAVVVNPQGGPDALRWPVDGQRYSTQKLLTKLEQEYGVCGIPIVYRNWRIAGHEESIWDEANARGGEPDDEIVPDPPSPRPKKPAPNSTSGQEREGRNGLQHWLRENVEKVVIPVIVAVLTAVILAWLGLNK